MKRRYLRTALVILLLVGVYAFLIVPLVQGITCPNEIVLTKSEYLRLSHQDADSPVSNDTDTPKYITVKLLGFIPLKKVMVNILPFETILVGGTPLGICGEIDGVLVTADTDDRVLRKGDVIQAVNGVKVQNRAEFDAQIADSPTAKITLLRNHKKMVKTIDPATPLALRDQTRGVGMLTFINPENNTFSALGHQMGDFETGASVDLCGGTVHTVHTFGIEKTAGKQTGLIKSAIQHSAPVQGSITQGTSYGVTGCLKADSEILARTTTTMPVATRYNVKPGKATLRTSLDGVTVEEFTCEILKTRFQEAKSDKSMIIRVTDKRLLEKTGGIVHGMSGSPIIQNGHIVGALTHAITHDPAKGYAIYLDFMAI